MKNHTRQRPRNGFTLIELLVGITIFAIIGVLFTQLLTTQGRFFDKQGMGNSARNVSRASLNRVVSDFRMIEATGGVVAATNTSLTVRIPYAIGVECGNANGLSHLSLLPVDSTTYAGAGFYGYAWRNYKTGAYVYVENNGTQEQDGTLAVCTGVSITPISNAKVVGIAPTLPDSAGLGTPVFLYSKVRYEFKPSTAIPGSLGLYRTKMSPGGGETTEELVAPFANTASWKFFVANGGAVAQTAVPAKLSDIRGLELHLDGMSETKAATKVTAETAPFTTAVFFKNRIN
jgi:prepilin-type N-terminal cleavage/methylation domain-containing protein